MMKSVLLKDVSSQRFYRGMRITRTVLPWRSLCWLVVLRNILLCRGEILTFFLKNVDLEDKIGHLFIVDIEFDAENATEKELMYNEILPPIIEKENILEANEPLVYQLLELFSKTTQNKPKSYRWRLPRRFEIFNKKMLLESYKNLLALYLWAIAFEKRIYIDESKVDTKHKKYSQKGPIQNRWTMLILDTIVEII